MQTPPSAPASKTPSPRDAPSPFHAHKRTDSFQSVTSNSSFGQKSFRSDPILAKRKSSVRGGKAAEIQVAAALTEDEAKRCSDRMVNQFLRATNGNVNLAIKRLKDTLAWRKQEECDTAFCHACSARRNSHYLQVCGTDELGRPVFYSNFALAASRNVEENRRHMIATFEQAIRAMPPDVEQWIWVADFHGFGMSDCDPRLARHFLDVSAKHYPERLGRFYIIDAPGIFSLLWKAITPMIDPVTRTKVVFLPYDAKKGDKSQLAKALTEDHSPEMQQWLLAEMKQNRSKKIAKTKWYPYGKQFASPPDLSHVVVEGHDCRGPPDFVRLCKENPGIMVPVGV